MAAEQVKTICPSKTVISGSSGLAVPIINLPAGIKTNSILIPAPKSKVLHIGSPVFAEYWATVSFPSHKGYETGCPSASLAAKDSQT
jgi:hypothetical protein